MLRTVGIYTDYIDTMSFQLNDKDKEYMLKVHVCMREATVRTLYKCIAMELLYHERKS